MPNPKLIELFDHLRASRFRAFAGARVTIDAPIAEPLLNDLIAASLPPHAPIRSASIHPYSNDQFSLRIVPKAAIMPAITLKLAIEVQPQLPSNPVLGLRMVTLGGLFGLAGGVIAGFLPPGITLQGERILVDLRTLAAQHGAADVFGYLTAIRVGSEPGRVILHLEASA
jgi:hypothetical protein